MPLSGRIVAWNSARGFGYVGTGDGRRIFLHIRDFVGRHRQPEIGDVVAFELGADPKGRPCAQKAVPVQEVARVRAVHALFFLLLFLPAMAIERRFGIVGLSYAGGGCLALSLLTYFAYRGDKEKARDQVWRTQETTLHLLALLGGWPGAFFAQRWLRHKSAKGPFQFVFVLIVGAYQFAAIDALCGWPFVRMAFALLGKSFGSVL